jgi:uncharacterized protein (TIGR02421 family)
VKKRLATGHEITDSFIDEVCSRLDVNRRVRRTLPAGGRLHIDRRLPFLCVYRRPPDRDDAGTRELVTGEASFLIAPGEPRYRRNLTRLVRRLVTLLASRFGAFLIVEVWSDRDNSASGQSLQPEAMLAQWKPEFVIATRGPNKPRWTVEMLERALQRIRVHRLAADVRTDDRMPWHAPGFSPLLPVAEARRLACHTLGIQVRPIYQDGQTGQVLPSTLRSLRRRFSRVLKQACFTFARTSTTVDPEHFHALGRRAMVKAVWEVDRRLSEIHNSFDFLLQATPVNTATAWSEFRRSRFERTPVLHYRPLSVEPATLKRRLFDVPIERIEDPTLAHLFRQRQDELDRKITMLSDVGTPRFLLGSLQVYGGVEPPLLELADQLLSGVSSRSREGAGGKHLDAEQFAHRVRQEIDYYRGRYPEFEADVMVRDDLYWGLLVSQGSLLVGKQTRVPPGRVEALLQHEIGTHLITYYNGRAQPFRQLDCGLAGYDALQEGLAVLSEALVDGLSPSRMRLLAARVWATEQMIRGATFVDTFRALCREHGFPRRQAFTLTTRIYRAGGLTKDIVYLRGLVEIMKYLREGGELEPLFVGKIAAEHVPLMRELQLRKVLRPAPMRPRYLDNPRTIAKLDRFRQEVPIRDLVSEGRSR